MFIREGWLLFFSHYETFFIQGIYCIWMISLCTFVFHYGNHCLYFLLSRYLLDYFLTKGNLTNLVFTSIFLVSFFLSLPTQLLMRLGELALVKVCSRTIHTLSLMTLGKDWAAELEIVLNSLIQAYRAEAFKPSSGCSKAEHRYSRTGTARLEGKTQHEVYLMKSNYAKRMCWRMKE